MCLHDSAKDVSSTSLHGHGISSEGHARDMSVIKAGAPDVLAHDSLVSDPDLPPEIRRVLDTPAKGV